MLPLLSWLPHSEKERNMKLSARNVIPGTIKDIEVGAVNVEVSVEVAPDLVMTSIITKGSYKNLELEVGKQVHVVVKASNVMIGAE
jgi:molybdate transport system regulatory protein